jgi:hypothetical protein
MAKFQVSKEYEIVVTADGNETEVTIIDEDGDEFEILTIVNGAIYFNELAAEEAGLMIE